MLSPRWSSRYVFGGIALVLLWLIVTHVPTTRPLTGAARLPWRVFRAGQPNQELGEVSKEVSSTISVTVESASAEATNAAKTPLANNHGTNEKPGNEVATTNVVVPQPNRPGGSPDPESTTLSKTVVMGRLMSEDTSWVQANLRDWQSSIYVVDVPENTTSPTGLQTSMNKAKEVTPYLTYIIEHYPDFPDVAVFMHSHRSGWPKAWHNDVAGHDAVTLLNKLRLSTIQQRGYANLRCTWDPGCPAEIRLDREEGPTQDAEAAFASVYAELFNVTVDDARAAAPVVATPCCAQFGVSREQLLRREKSEYEHFMDVVARSDYDDETLGTVMEYMWHIIFGQPPVSCEGMRQCIKALYGRRP